MLTYGSVCSGVEAASLAWEPLGWRPAWFAEIEKFPSAVLALRWPDVPNLGDMTTLPARIRAREVPAPDVLVGGTPCQAFSLPGKRQSLTDPRGQLTLAFVEIANAIDEIRKADGLPACIVVWENVPGVLNLADNAFGYLLAGLSGEPQALEPGERPDRGRSSRYWQWKKKTNNHAAKWTRAGGAYGQLRSVAWRVLDAQFFGTPQRRKRVIVIASAGDGFDPLQVLAESKSVRGDLAPGGEPQPQSAAAAAHGAGDEYEGCTAFGGGNTQGPITVSTTLTTSNQRIDFDTETLITFPAQMSGTQYQCNDGSVSPTIQARNPTAVCMGQPHMLVRRLTVLECERLQGFPEGHTDIIYRGKPAPDTPRYKAIGNSMAVPVMAWLGRRIAAALTAAPTPQPMSKPVTTKHQKSFLRWAGGKFLQLNQVLPHLPAGKRLIEPFVGAGNVFINAPGYERYLLGDTNPDVINLFNMLMYANDKVLEQLRWWFQPAFNTQDAFLKIRQQFNRHEFTAPERAAAFIYLNRHCFNGLCRYNQLGEFNVGFGSLKAPYFPVDELVAFDGLNHDKLTFKAGDYSKLLYVAGEGDVVYCDPPYEPLPGTDGFTSYSGDSFSFEEQIRLASQCVAAHGRGARVVINNSGAPKITELYQDLGFTLHPMKAKRSMSCKQAGRLMANDITAVL